jgi:hypothetical protein
MRVGDIAVVRREMRILQSFCGARLQMGMRWIPDSVLEGGRSFDFRPTCKEARI